jgi:uncharacterized DUF497 family protein
MLLWPGAAYHSQVRTEAPGVDYQGSPISLPSLVAPADWDRGQAGSGPQHSVMTNGHGIDFADAVTALDDGHAITVQDTLSAGETRYITVGMNAMGRVLTVVCTWRGDIVRLISARPATPGERREYGDSI